MQTLFLAQILAFVIFQTNENFSPMFPPSAFWLKYMMDAFSSLVKWCICGVCKETGQLSGFLNICACHFTHWSVSKLDPCYQLCCTSEPAISLIKRKIVLVKSDSVYSYICSSLGSLFHTNRFTRTFALLSHTHIKVIKFSVL